MDWFTDPNRPYIQLFGLNHILYVLIVAVAITLLLTRRRWGRTNRALVHWSILAISLTQFSLMQIWYLSQPTFNLGDGLPLHISRITTLLGLAWLLTRKRELMDLASFLGIFAYFTFLLPQRIYPITHLMGWSFLVPHALIIILTSAGLWRHDSTTSTGRPSLNDPAHPRAISPTSSVYETIKGCHSRNS